ncbi:hypothetical protein [Gilvimarinus polysaccharolyticus]|uniref:hypothetical protein n=1 Tax=Gilvimarinus polysaccharolyticus TaxID=863921 RepID=UPI000673B8DE|nr:hypothetical protein [Gilvimarinus polysaccharolyticus]
MESERYYLDQSVLSAISEGSVKLGSIGDSYFVYSNEHYKEIHRGNASYILDALSYIKARKMIILSDENGNLNDDWKLFGYIDPQENYQYFINHWESNILADRLLKEMFCAAVGRDSLRDQFEDTTEKIVFSELGNNFDNVIKPEIKKLASEFSKTLPNEYKIESNRERLGVSKGGLKKFKKYKNPIPFIWRKLNSHYPSKNYSMDELFGFKASDFSEAFNPNLSTYLSILHCYGALNYIGFEPDDGVANPRRVSNNFSDASHVGLAAYCHRLYTCDERMATKAKAIYSYRNLACKVILVKKNGVN